MRCPLVDARPVNSKLAFMRSLKPLTAGKVHTLTVGGDHFSMLYGEHTVPLAEALAPFVLQ